MANLKLTFFWLYPTADLAWQGSVIPVQALPDRTQDYDAASVCLCFQCYYSAYSGTKVVLYVLCAPKMYKLTSSWTLFAAINWEVQTVPHQPWIYILGNISTHCKHSSCLKLMTFIGSDCWTLAYQPRFREIVACATEGLEMAWTDFEFEVWDGEESNCLGPTTLLWLRWASR